MSQFIFLDNRLFPQYAFFTESNKKLGWGSEKHFSVQGLNRLLHWYELFMGFTLSLGM